MLSAASLCWCTLHCAMYKVWKPLQWSVHTCGIFLAAREKIKTWLIWCFFQRTLTQKVNSTCVRVSKCVHTSENKNAVSCSCEKNTRECEYIHHNWGFLRNLRRTALRVPGLRIGVPPEHFDGDHHGPGGARPVHQEVVSQEIRDALRLAQVHLKHRIIHSEFQSTTPLCR